MKWLAMLWKCFQNEWKQKKEKEIRAKTSRFFANSCLFLSLDHLVFMNLLNFSTV